MGGGGFYGSLVVVQHLAYGADDGVVLVVLGGTFGWKSRLVE